MRSDDKDERPPDDVQSISIIDDFMEIAYGTDYRDREDGYHRDSITITRILDNHGQTVPGIWEKEWTEIAPGIQTRREGGSTRSGRHERANQQSIRIYRSACPVNVQVHYAYQYVSYEDEGSHSSYDEWRRYEAADLDSKQN